MAVRGQEGGPAAVPLLEELDGALGVLLPVHHNVLQAGPQGDLQGHGAADAALDCRFATGPWTPRRVFRSAACITTRTALLNPSYSFSISVRRRIREFRSFRSMVSWRWASLAAFSRFWRLSIRRVWPWMTLSAAAASS